MSSSSRSNPGTNLLASLLGILIVFSLFSGLSLWWIISLIVGSLTIVFFIARSLHHARVQRLYRQQLLALSPSEFEQRIALLLEDLGWQNVVVRGGSGDRGVDITAQRDGLRYIIQCKRYTKPVGPNYVRDLVGALQIQQADRAILVTTSTFTNQSRLEARGQALELWDYRILWQRIEEAEQRRLTKQQRRKRSAALPFAFALGLNLVVAGIAFSISGPPVISIDRIGQPVSVGTMNGEHAMSRSLGTNSPTPQSTVPNRPSVTPRPTRTPQPTATPQPTPTPVRPTASVFNGGNVRAAPNLQGTVLDQIHAYETVILLGRNADGVWIRIINPRGQEGWVHRSLLTLDPAIAETLPVITP